MKKNIVCFILGGLLFGIIGVNGVLLYKASDIEFVPKDDNWNVNNLNEAINDLYDNRVSLIYLGTGTSFDVKNKLPNNIDYSKLTSDNFIVEATSKDSTTIGGYTSGGANSDYITARTSLTKTYNPETGILTSYYNVYAIGHLFSSNSGSWFTKPVDWNLDVKAYLVIGEIK